MSTAGSWVVVVYDDNGWDSDPESAFGPFDSKQDADEHAKRVAGIVLPLFPKEAQ